MQLVPNFAWVDPEDSTFIQDFARYDEWVFSFELKQEEGEFATLDITIKNPRAALLSVSRKTWMWLSYGAPGSAVPLFFGRLVGIPTSILNEKVTLQFVAQPMNYNAQRAMLAASLRVLPNYDPIFVDENSRDDVDVVLDGYTKLWHVDPVTHDVTISDVLIGEDGIEEFTDADMLYDGLSISFDKAPLTTVSVTATIPWTQRAQGTVDLTEYLASHWPNETPSTSIVTSFTMNENDWPKVGSNIGSGWEVSQSSCVPLYDLTVKSSSTGGTLAVVDAGSTNAPAPNDTSDVEVGSSVSVTIERSEQYLSKVPPGSITLAYILTQSDLDISYTKIAAADYDVELYVPTLPQSRVASFSRQMAWDGGLIALNWLKVNLVVAYDAERQREEVVTFTLTADVQPIVTDPGDDATLELKLNAVAVSDPIDPSTTDQDTPIDDLRRRSYIVTPRGEQTIQHLIGRAAANLIYRSRCVKIEFAPLDIAKMAAITLRKNARIFDDRIPGGEALGKVISRSISLDGDTGKVAFKVGMGCAVGNGGTVSDVEGDPIYVEDDYIGPDDDWQEYDGRLVAVFDSSVSYEPPLFAPNDDGLDFIAGFEAEDVIQEALSVENGPAAQRASLTATTWIDAHQIGADVDRVVVKAREDALSQMLQDVPTVATFKLKNMKAKFSAPQEITVSDLKIPAMINLGD